MTNLSDAELSLLIAKQAGTLLLELRESYGPLDAGDKEQADALRKQGDRVAHELLADALGQHRPQDALLSEEGADNADRLDASRLWIVDPLDGTWEYGQGRWDFAVHVALWEPALKRLSACTVDLPAQGICRSMLDEVSAEPAFPTDRPVRVVASRTRPPANLGRTLATLGERLAKAGLNEHGVELMDVGSVGAKVNELVSGRAEIYVHDSGFYEWDVAAPYGVARHYGFVPSHINGDEIEFNHMPPWVPNLLVCHPLIVDYVRDVLAEAARG
ncbi:MAG TPA: 3'(2'),5'-bisphosphate nucleotidase CysQ [Actinobacteria bacterium]|nr:3'(2'),5'-bisphosphate nucleotidase CysQ [Actinomycetota bacterium]